MPSDRLLRRFRGNKFSYRTVMGTQRVTGKSTDKGTVQPSDLVPPRPFPQKVYFPPKALRKIANTVVHSPGLTFKPSVDPLTSL